MSKYSRKATLGILNCIVSELRVAGSQNSTFVYLVSYVLPCVTLLRVWLGIWSSSSTRRLVPEFQIWVSEEGRSLHMPKMQKGMMNIPRQTRGTEISSFEI